MSRRPTPKKWFPKNPQKYAGDVNNIVSRSSWETRFFEWCDTNSAVVCWESEETKILYTCQTDFKQHRYFLDVKLKIRDTSGNTSVYLIEIKPWAQTQPPKFPGRQTQRYITEVETFIKNQSKWKAATQYAKERGMKFMILTEKELFGDKKK